jgi:hypothetical protein
MRIRSFFVFGSVLFLIAANALAGPKEDVAAATAKWGETLAQNDPDKVVACMPQMRFSGARFRQRCEATERRSVTISSAHLRSYRVLRYRSASN